jgi:hypothetical protein
VLLDEQVLFESRKTKKTEDVWLYSADVPGTVSATRTPPRE